MGISKYKVKQFPHGETIIAELPCSGAITMLMGNIRIFPAIDKYRDRHHLGDGPVITIVDIPNKKVIYRKMIMAE